MFDTTRPVLSVHNGHGWITAEPFAFYDETLGRDGVFLDVPAGFVTVMDLTRPTAKADVLLDWIYSGAVPWATRRYADGLWRRAAGELGMGFVARWLRWLALRLLAGRRWRDG